MEEALKNQQFSQFDQTLPEVENLVKKAESVLAGSVSEKYNLKNYTKVLEGDDKEVIDSYEKMYDELHDTIVNKDSSIVKSIETAEKLEKVYTSIKKIADKEEDNSNEMKYSINKLVDRIIEREEQVYQRDVFNRKKQYEKRVEELLQKKMTPTKPPNSQMEKIGMCMNSLRTWSGLNKCSLIFDSNTDGDDNQDLCNKLINKSKLYFINFDDDGNIFGGYFSGEISKINWWLPDPNAFVFSLFRNGRENQRMFKIKPQMQHAAFFLYPKSDWLYCFGNGTRDMSICKIGNENSWCYPCYFDYEGVEKALTDYENVDEFPIRRFVVFQME
ncbi:TLDc domain-containing protein [Entamoeba marina]